EEIAGQCVFAHFDGVFLSKPTRERSNSNLLNSIKELGAAVSATLAPGAEPELAASAFDYGSVDDAKKRIPKITVSLRDVQKQLASSSTLLFEDIIRLEMDVGS